MTILFCHGLESGPVGRKVLALRAAGLAIEAPDFRGMALAERVAKVRELLRAHDGAVVIGSSYGGATAIYAAMEHVEAGGAVRALVLCAPALMRGEPPASERPAYAPAPTVIIHGTRDDVVPIAVSRELAARDARVELIEVDDDHRLSASDGLLIATVRRFV